MSRALSCVRLPLRNRAKRAASCRTFQTGRGIVNARTSWRLPLRFSSRLVEPTTIVIQLPRGDHRSQGAKISVFVREDDAIFPGSFNHQSHFGRITHRSCSNTSQLCGQGRYLPAQLQQIFAHLWAGRCGSRMLPSTCGESGSGKPWTSFLIGHKSMEENCRDRRIVERLMET